MEYAVLLAIVVAALVAMQTYIKRGLSGRLRTSADSVGMPYEPSNTTSNVTLTVRTDTTTESSMERDRPIGGGETADVLVTKTTINESSTERSGDEWVGPLRRELWRRDEHGSARSP
ncbi:MAG: hypothetical protein HYY90_05035 [Candidatus Omnitrophica bacterium]|nr:hypothetical protein [Candidatus Omnitrophota bacterium]MBI3020776.1 hypothetical protein [Candidatus Omnitrophota bacterium]MBI3083708.1 hypothetical protein [Candidatus Omnitrophota bacterium]